MASFLVEGWTKRITYQLLTDNTEVDLSGATVTLHARDRHKNVLSLSGSVGIVSGGTVYFDPASQDILNANSPMQIRFKVVDAAGKISFFPNSREWEQWIISLP